MKIITEGITEQRIKGNIAVGPCYSGAGSAIGRVIGGKNIVVRKSRSAGQGIAIQGRGCTGRNGKIVLEKNGAIHYRPEDFRCGGTAATSGITGDRVAYQRERRIDPGDADSLIAPDQILNQRRARSVFPIAEETTSQA